MTSQGPARPGKRRRYDWDKLFGKDSFSLVEGRDYPAGERQPRSISQIIRNVASARGVFVRIKRTEKGISVEVKKEPVGA